MRAGARWPHLIKLPEDAREERPFVPFPFFVGYAAAVLKAKGHDVFVIDAVADSLDEVEFLARVLEISPQIVAMSALLSTTMPSMPRTVEALKAAGLRDKVKVMIGGAPVTERYAEEIGADAYASDAGSAVARAKELLGVT